MTHKLNTENKHNVVVLLYLWNTKENDSQSTARNSYNKIFEGIVDVDSWKIRKQTTI